MKAAMISATVLVASLMFADQSQAQNYFGRGFDAGLPYYGFGYSGSLYGLGYVPVPPYYALHPPVYYSHEIIRRPVGDSPYAYRSRRPDVSRRQFSRNPFVPDTVLEDGSPQSSQPSDSVAQVIVNPFYGSDQRSLLGSKLIFNPYYAKPEAAVAQTSR